MTQKNNVEFSHALLFPMIFNFFNFSNVFHMPCFFPWFSFFSRKTNFAKNFSLMSKILFVSKTNLHLILILWKSGRKFSHVFHNLDVKCKFRVEDKRILDIKEKFLAKCVFLEKKQKSWEKVRHVKIQHCFFSSSPFFKNFFWQGCIASAKTKNFVEEYTSQLKRD